MTKKLTKETIDARIAKLSVHEVRNSNLIRKWKSKYKELER